MRKFLFLLMVTIMLSAQVPEKKLVVELGLDQQSYKLGDEVFITARICNRGVMPFSIYKYLLWGHRGGLVLEVTDESGHKIEAEQLDEDRIIPSTLKSSSAFLEIPPDHGWSVLRHDTTNNLFGKPGRYVVRVRYLGPVPRKYFPEGSEQWATEDGPVFSVPITIEVK